MGTFVAAAALLGSLAFAYTVTQSHSDGTFTYSVAVGTGETPVRDFHLRAPKGKDIKVVNNGVSNPKIGETTMTGWNSNSAPPYPFTAPGSEEEPDRDGKEIVAALPMRVNGMA